VKLGTHKIWFSFFYLLISFINLDAQDADCNKLGVWLWRMEQTGFDSYEQLADSLSNLGIKRIYIKVADGGIDSVAWPTLVNRSITDIFHNYDMEAYAWSFNYPGNNESQAKALYASISTGYDGYVIDVESQFDGTTTVLDDLMRAFKAEKQRAIDVGLIDDSFIMGVTTWGNPDDHNFRIDIMDPYIDAYFPQTYLEAWGPDFLENPGFWIEAGNREYRELGATKPIHHIINTERNLITSEQLNEFIKFSGAETSLWRIPGGSTTFAIWQDWLLIDWNRSFCTLTNSETIAIDQYKVYPNPVTDILNITSDNTDNVNYCISDILGHKIITGQLLKNQTINLASLESGYYTLNINNNNRTHTFKLIKS